MSRSAPEQERRIDPALDRQVRTGAATPFSEAKVRTCRDMPRGSRGNIIDAILNSRATYRDGKLGTGDGDPPIVFEFDHGTDDRDFERRGIDRVSDHGVRNAMRAGIHRSGNRNAHRLPSPAAKVLHRRLQPRPDDPDGPHQRGAMRCQPPGLSMG
jgi:hypothetical protein